MRRFLLLICLLLGAAAYGVWPFYTAWSIKEAVKSGDSAYLVKHIEWAPVKETLKASMTDMMLQPVAETMQKKPQRKGLWSSFKAYYGRTMVESIVERYANPTDLPQLFSYGRTIRRDLLGRIDPDEGQPLHTRIANAWARIDRAAFITPVRFEIDLRDKFEPTRVYAGVLELKDWRWIVTQLRVYERPPRKPARRPAANPEPEPEISGLQISSKNLAR